MKFKDMKKTIRKLEKENRDLISRNCALKSMDERCVPYNDLEILIRPQRRENMIRYEAIGLNLRVMGNDKMPTICNYKTIPLSAFDLLQENKKDFIKDIGELMAAELMACGEKVKSK